MADQWKSTPTYWCKYCATYVRDTKLERTNHDASSKHQYSVKRFLRTLHRKHEQEERDKQAARREIARVTGVRESDLEGSSSSSSAPARRAGADKPAAPTEQQLQKQREQLAELGVAVPGDFRPEMAMPGEWTVTKIIERKTETRTTNDDQDKVEAKAVGTRKREAPEDQKEEEEALKGLFKKTKRWGRDSKAMPSEEDEELDALLNGSPFLPVKSEREETAKKEEAEDDDKANIKTEEQTPNEGPTDDVKPKMEVLEEALVKPEPEDDSGIKPIVFKKRKPKGIRQK